MNSFFEFIDSIFRSMRLRDPFGKYLNYDLVEQRREYLEQFSDITELPKTALSKRIRNDNDGADLSNEEVILIAENIRHYQNRDGGWGKNGHYRKDFSRKELKKVYEGDKKYKYPRGASDFDNESTWGQIEYLVEAHCVTGDELFRDSIIDGVEYIVKAQHEDGSWENKNHPHITYNDGVQQGVMTLLHKIINNTDNRYDFLDEITGELDLEKVYEKGLDIILKTQIEVDGELRIWGQQHDHETLEPTWARSYEMPAYATSESVGILDFFKLHLSTNPDDKKVQKSYDAAVDFLRDIQLEDGTWARFYHLEEVVPIFANRDSTILYNYEDLDPERRDGYSWFNDSANRHIL